MFGKKKITTQPVATASEAAGVQTQTARSDVLAADTEVPTAKPASKSRSKSSRPDPACSNGGDGASRQANKQTVLLTLLRRPGGALLPELIAASGWQVHSVRGFLSGTVKKKLGLTVVTDVGEGGRSYRIVEDQTSGAKNDAA